MITRKNFKERLTETNSETPMYKCHRKLHKENNPVRPIISFNGATAYKISKVCTNILKNCYEFKEKYRIKNSKEVVRILRTEVQIGQNTKLISLDVVDMFTTIPVEIGLELIEKNKLSGFEHKEELIRIIKECISQKLF